MHGELRNNPEANEEAVKLPDCFMLRRIVCPAHAPGITMFWKVTIGVTAVLMLVFALTMWGMAVSLGRSERIYAEEHRATMAAIGRLSEVVAHHQQLTLENRVVQSEIRGLVQGWITERRNVEQGRQQRK
jgi:hypothetical protein